MKIENILVAENVDELIELLFEEVLDVREQSYYDGELYYSYNVNLPKIKKSNFNTMHGFFKIFYIAESKAKKIFLGDNNKYDPENYKQQSREYLFLALDSVLHGEHNAKLEKDLKINSVDDVKKIIKNKKLTVKFTNYILTYVQMKLRELSQSKSNPDFTYDKNEGYIPIYYDYIDNEELNIQLEEKGNINKSGEFTEYFFRNIFPSFSMNQQKFIHDALEYGIFEQEVRNYKGELLYNTNQIKNYKRNIRKKMNSILEEDNNIELKNGRYVIIH